MVTQFEKRGNRMSDKEKKLSPLQEREMKRRRSAVRTAMSIDIQEIEEKNVAKSEGEVVNIPLEVLVPFHNHPFRVKDDEEMDKLEESIKDQGVLYPLLVRPLPEGGMEIIAGHRRCHAAKKAGLTEVPAVIKELNDAEAEIIMVDSNIQRENISYSEKAFAYKIKMNAMNRQGKKSKDGTSINSAAQIGEAAGDSKRTVFRYIRLTYLIKEVLELVDQKKIPAFTTGLALSYLDEEEQITILSYYEISGKLPTPAQAEQLKKAHEEFAEEGKLLDVSTITRILSDKKKVQKKIVFKGDNIRKFFAEDTSDEEIEETIISLLEKWQYEKRE